MHVVATDFNPLLQRQKSEQSVVDTVHIWPEPTVLNYR